MVFFICSVVTFAHCANSQVSNIMLNFIVNLPFHNIYMLQQSLCSLRLKDWSKHRRRAFSVKALCPPMISKAHCCWWVMPAVPSLTKGMLPEGTTQHRNSVWGKQPLPTMPNLSANHSSQCDACRVIGGVKIPGGVFKNTQSKMSEWATSMFFFLGFLALPWCINSSRH